MKVLYKVGGTLSKDFIGQISYTVCLDRKYEELDIEFSFDKQKYTAEDVTEDVIRELTDYCRSNYGLELPPGADPVKEIMDSAKTEIHTLATDICTFAPPRPLRAVSLRRILKEF